MNDVNLSESIEQWNVIPDCEGFYEASTFGRIRSVPRIIIRKNGQPMRLAGRILKPASGSDPYDHLSVVIAIRGHLRTRAVHRLVWEAFNGRLSPEILLDHEDRNRLNNALSNLRIANLSQNGGNSRLSKRNSSGKKGVYQPSNLRKSNRWVARITVSRKGIHLGVFATAEEASAAYAHAAARYFGKFANP